jgi:AmmeMemoRadiSam system protein B
VVFVSRLVVVLGHFAAVQRRQGLGHVVRISIGHSVSSPRPAHLRSFAGKMHPVPCRHRIVNCRDCADGIIFGGVAGPKYFSVRQAAVAGTFYPADPRQCQTAATALVQTAAKTGADSAQPSDGVGGVIPHAGWICSGAIAGQVLGTLARDVAPEIVVIFGAVHTPIELPVAALDSHSVWSIPGAEFEVARDLAESLQRSSAWFRTDDRFHVREHAVEVELPLVRAVWPGARLLPVEVPVADGAPEIGRQVARAVLETGARAVFLASSDLTHYGPSYRFAPAGIGPQGLAWAKDNDRRLLRIVENFDIDQVVPEVHGHLNACGGGAIAAMLAACKEAGATNAKVLRHANSYETLAAVAPQPPVDAVGYAGVIVSRSSTNVAA